MACEISCETGRRRARPDEGGRLSDLPVSSFLPLISIDYVYIYMFISCCFLFRYFFGIDVAVSKLYYNLKLFPLA